MTDDVVVTIPIRLRVLTSSADPPETSPAVHCPREDRTVDALGCVECAHVRGIDLDPSVGGTLSCTAPPPTPESHPRRMDLSEAAARRPLHEVIRPVTTCVTQDASAASARRLLAQSETRALPVVDDAMKLVGIVSRVDVLFSGRGRRVRDVMSRRVCSLPENAPVGHAIALMATDQISEVPVVTEDGELVGVWHALDALRWTAQALGYVLPPVAPARRPVPAKE